MKAASGSSYRGDSPVRYNVDISGISYYGDITEAADLRRKEVELF